MNDNVILQGKGSPDVDWEGAYNSREWLRAALEGKGAEVVGGGFGVGGADLDIMIDGMPFSVTIKPVGTDG